MREFLLLGLRSWAIGAVIIAVTALAARLVGVH